MICTSNQLLIPEMVSRVAACAPGCPAVIQQDRVLDYGSLNQRANQVARYLKLAGAGAEDRIGISMGRSIEFVIAALGILRSGAAYVPIDPSYPEARRRLIIEDARPKKVLSWGQRGTIKAEHADVVPIDAPEILSQSTADFEVDEEDQQRLAYVIYTSGSTGVPKGVEVTHGNLQHLIRWHNDAFQVTDRDRATLLANVGFDAAVWEMWPYLCAGATLTIPQPEVVREPDALRDWLVESEVSIMFAPTLLAEVLMQASWPEGTTLRCMLTGGDTLRLAPRPGLPFRLINNYGPAECTVVSTSGEVVAHAERQAKTPSIGRAISGARVYVLDDTLREVPTGTPGEICIAGEGVARGYLNQPELTAERFAVRQEDGVRLYRSGDLGSCDEHGFLQFLGRLDEQIKIRGYRIECGEIEAAMNSLPAVRSSAVVLRDSEAGRPILTAYIVAKDGVALNRDGLRESLRLHVPEYMLPEQFVRLEQMPISENGKIDRRNLPLPTEATRIGTPDLPTSAVETELMEVIAKLLKVDHVERNDDFFLLGGHSFIAAQLIARIRDRFGVELSLRTVFDNPTLVGMAQQIEKRLTVHS